MLIFKDIKVRQNLDIQIQNSYKGEIIMRKMLNKKGFSLVELMIVVVIMGILIAVAIPLYGAVTANSKNKTCLNNIKAIKSNAANYYASYDVAGDSNNIASMFDNKQLPVCPWDNQSFTVTPVDGDAGNVTIKHVGAAHAADADGCKQNVTGGEYAHA